MENILQAKVSDRSAYLSLFLALTAFFVAFSAVMDARSTAAELTALASRRESVRTERNLHYAAARHRSIVERLHPRDIKR